MYDEHDDHGSSLDRRSFLAVGGATLLATGLVACGGSSSDSTSGSPASGGGTPKRGGTMRIGVTGGSDTDTLDGQNLLTNPDYARNLALFEGLTNVGSDGKVVMRLAESIEPNRDGSKWTIKVRPNVILHDGTKFGAKDVLFSLKRIVSKKYPGTVSLGPIDLDASRVRDELTLEVAFTKPYAIFPEGLTLPQSVMVPEGFDPASPVGTGPYKYKSFTPNNSSTFVRHDQYWQEGKPYFDSIVINDIKDETTMVNALQAGQLDAITYLSSTSINAVRGAGATVITSKTGAWGPLVMRNDKAPFNDPRVRQAFRLVIDRPQMNEQIFNGLGSVGNDVWGIYDPAFAGQKLPQRAQDIEQAKSLLTQAGHGDLAVQLTASDFGPGMRQTAEVFATDSKAAGIRTNVDFQDSTRFFATSFLKATFTQDFWPTQPYLVASQQAVGPGAPYNGTFQDNAGYNKLYNEATRTLDDPKRFEIMNEMRRYDYDQGGYIIPYLYPNIDAVTSSVKGVKTSVTGVALNNCDWPNLWLES